MIEECSNCNTKFELCCESSKRRYQFLLDELASKNRALEELRANYDKVCRGLQEKHLTNQELAIDLEKANQASKKWEKHCEDYKVYSQLINETWRKSYDGVASEVNLLKRQLREMKGCNR